MIARGNRIVCGIMVMASALIVAGCSGAGSTAVSSTARSGLDLTAEVDPVRGSVTLPADRFGTSFLEQSVLMEGGTVAMAACGRAIGVPWTASEASDDPEYDMATPFGPWTKEIAGRFAFVEPATNADLIANGYLPGELKADHPNLKLTEEQLDKMDACQGDAQGMKFDVIKLEKLGPWTEEFNESHDKTLKDTRAKEVFGELRVCYSEHGMTFDEERPGFVKEARDEITEGQIALALKVAECQEETDATKRLADIQADIQAPTIEKYADELTAQRARIDKALVEAKAYSAAHPELFEAPK